MTVPFDVQQREYFMSVIETLMEPYWIVYFMRDGRRVIIDIVRDFDEVTAVIETFENDNPYILALAAPLTELYDVYRRKDTIE